MKELSPDADVENADWTKRSWDFPPYKSREFMELVPDLDAFRKTSAYKHAVAEGLILDDEWLADWVTTKKKRPVRIHLH